MPNPPVLCRADGTPVTFPCILADFRGNLEEVVSATPPERPGSTGRVYTVDGAGFYPSVFDLHWEV